jgi:Sap, sulfolipid-1-addressing protein
MAGTLIFLSLTSSLNPTLLAVTSLMLLRDRPARMMCGFLAGASTISISLGIAIVLAFNGSHPVKTTRHTLNPGVDIALGCFGLAISTGLRTDRYRRWSERRRARHHDRSKPPRWQRVLDRGTARMAFVAGLVLTLPGASYLAGLDAIHRHHPSTVAVVIIVIAFNLVMLWILELPLLGYAFAPTSTPRRMAAVRAWVSRHSHQLAVRGSATIGVLLVIKGVIGLLS